MKLFRNRQTTTWRRTLAIFLTSGASVLLVVGMIAGALITLTKNQTFADNIQVSVVDTWDSVPENEIQIDTSKINFAQAVANGNVTINGDFKIYSPKLYTQEDVANGTYDAEREDDANTSFELLPGKYTNLAYTGGVTAGINNVPGSVTVRYSNAAKTADGDYCDLIITYKDLVIDSSVAFDKPISFTSQNGMALRPQLALNAGIGSELVWKEEQNNFTLGKQTLGSDYSGIGVSVNLRVQVVEAGTNQPIDKKMVMRFIDLDTGDLRGCGSNNIYVHDDGSPCTYAESIVLVNGIESNAYMLTGNTLITEDTEYGANTWISGTELTENTGAEKGHEYSTVIFAVDSTDFEFQWRCNRGAGTILGFIQASKVKTSTTGTYADKGSITPTDNEVLWKETKTITITPQNNYKVSKVTVDGVEVDFTPNADGTVTYIFNNVVDDHTISAEFAPIESKITVKYIDEDTGEEITTKVEKTDAIGETYQPEEKTVDGYRISQRPEQAEYTFNEAEQTVIFKYKKLGKVTVYHCKEGEDCSDPEPDAETCATTGEKCEPLSEPEVIVCVRNEQVDITAKSIADYALSSQPDSLKAECDVDPDNPNNPDGSPKQKLVFRYNKKKPADNPSTADTNIAKYALVLGGVAMASGVAILIAKNKFRK